jgi:NADH-quinone oxidoreductase subunit J
MNMMNDITLDIILLALMLTVSLWTVMTASLLRSAIGLAVASVILSIIIFRLDSPLAAVFELSVCAGLISVIFISAISLTGRVKQDNIDIKRKEVLRRFWPLPLIIAVLGIYLALSGPPSGMLIPKAAESGLGVRDVLWKVRQLDLIGQVTILLAGAIGVVLLFVEKRDD